MKKLALAILLGSFFFVEVLSFAQTNDIFFERQFILEGVSKWSFVDDFNSWSRLNTKKDTSQFEQVLAPLPSFRPLPGRRGDDKPLVRSISFVPKSLILSFEDKDYFADLHFDIKITAYHNRFKLELCNVFISTQDSRGRFYLYGIMRSTSDYYRGLSRKSKGLYNLVQEYMDKQFSWMSDSLYCFFVETEEELSKIDKTRNVWAEDLELMTGIRQRSY